MALREFPTFDWWVNKASSWMRPGDICTDAKGRRCRIGQDFMRARDEGAFPVTITSELSFRSDGGLDDWAIDEARRCESRMNLSFPLHDDAVETLARTLMYVYAAAMENTLERREIR